MGTPVLSNRKGGVPNFVQVVGYPASSNGVMVPCFIKQGRVWSTSVSSNGEVGWGIPLSIQRCSKTPLRMAEFTEWHNQKHSVSEKVGVWGEIRLLEMFIISVLNSYHTMEILFYVNYENRHVYFQFQPFLLINVYYFCKRYIQILLLFYVGCGLMIPEVSTFITLKECLN